MTVRNPTRLKWMFGLLLLAALACQNTTAASTPATTMPVPASTSTQSTAPSGPPTQNPNAPVDLPAKRTDQAGDINSSSRATKKSVSGGDVFVKDLYERPFNANTMDTYFPYVDIIDTQGFKDDTWGYATITMAGADKDGHLSAQYAVELDLNKDGRGDWLIRATNPSSTTWTTQGVQAWKDANGDVGGGVPLVADNKTIGGDGYETLVFDQGKGDLTDGAWVRTDPNDPNTVQFAFRLSMLGSPASFAMGAWAGTNIDPAMFDYNDHMTHIQAGSPNFGDTIYPLKAMAEIDNTCRLAVGFTPNGSEPGVCKNIVPIEPGVAAPAAPSAPAPQPCIPGITAAKICP